MLGGVEGDGDPERAGARVDDGGDAGDQPVGAHVAVVGAHQGGLLVEGDPAHVALGQGGDDAQARHVDDLEGPAGGAGELSDAHIAGGDHAVERGGDAGLALVSGRFAPGGTRGVELVAQVGELAVGDGAVAVQALHLGVLGLEPVQLGAGALGAGVEADVLEDGQQVALADGVALVAGDRQHHAGGVGEEVGLGLRLHDGARDHDVRHGAGRYLEHLDHGRRLRLVGPAVFAVALFSAFAAVFGPAASAGGEHEQNEQPNRPHGRPAVDPL